MKAGKKKTTLSLIKKWKKINSSTPLSWSKKEGGDLFQAKDILEKQTMKKIKDLKQEMFDLYKQIDKWEEKLM